jgi:hypothetical protein
MTSLGISKQAKVTWRVSLDRAWRSEPFRREFEAECGLPPLAESAEDQAKQAFAGYAETYHDRFLLWATTKLGLEQEAPNAIRQKLSVLR